MSGGMTLSASPMTYQEGIVFHPTAARALSAAQRAASGRCVAANRAATSASSADANTVPKYLELMYRSAPLPSNVGILIVKSDGGFGALASSNSIDSPASGANASTNTNAFTFGALAEATLITEPPYEWPTRTTGPATNLRYVEMTAASAARPRTGFGRARAGQPSLCGRWVGA